MAVSSEVVTATLETISFQRDDFVIARFRLNDSGATGTKGRLFSALGTITNPQPQMDYKLRGQWEEPHPTFGRQFKFNWHEAVVPKDTDGIFRYLVRVAKWVGPTVGSRLVDRYGEKTLDVLKTDPEQVAKQIKGITVQRALEIQEALKGQEQTEAAMVELEGLFAKVAGLKKSLAADCVKMWGANAAVKLRQNPYLLTRIRGIGFASADKVAMALGYDPAGPERETAAVRHVVIEQMQSTGSVWIDRGVVSQSVMVLVGMSGTRGFEKLKAERFLVEGEGSLSTAVEAGNEADISRMLIRVLNGGNNLGTGDVDRTTASTETGITLTEEQTAAVEMIRRHRIGVLTGGPGTGKTTTVRQILEWARSQRLPICQCAPTGKAAKRMAEATGQPAATIHRALGGQMDDTGEFVFEFGPEHPLPAGLLVVDETSMITNALMADLLRAVDPDKTKVLFVGDHGQLPSVGPGAVLRDLLAAEVVPTTRLTKIHRNSGAIVQACHAINTGSPIDPPTVLDPATGKNFRHIEAEDIEQIQQIIRMLVAERMPARGYDPVWDVQTISPTNSRTALSCDGLNDVLQRQLNPNAPAADYGDKCPQWRIGDKVIQTKNTKVKATGTEIVNGDMGQIIAADTKTLTVKFFLPERIVKLPAKGNNLLLAYCVTCHRMQGSEAKVVIVPVHRSFGPFVTRSWIYTAISRAKDICITVGQFDAFVAAIGRQDAVERNTKLVQRLQQAFVDAEDI